MIYQNRNFSWRCISQSEIRNSAAAESEGGQKFLPPNPLPFCPPERSVWRAKRAVSSVQKRFGFRQTNAPRSDEQAQAIGRRCNSCRGRQEIYEKQNF